MTTAIILAAGKSERLGTGADKAFLSLGNKPVVAWSLLAFERCPLIDNIILVVRKDQILASKAVAKMFGISKLTKVLPGGNKRPDSVLVGLAACDFDTKYVVIHDAARPLVTSDNISEIVKLVKRNAAVTLGKKIVDTVKRVDKGTAVVATEDREKLWTVQTPQAFNIKALKDAYAKLPGDASPTDDCQVMELAGESVKILENRKPNIKITTIEDFEIASALLKP